MIQEVIYHLSYNFIENLFKAITNEQLSSVEFIQDYLQLHFDGNTLTLYSWPEVNINSERYKFGDVNYRDILCEVIGRIVSRVSLIENNQLDIFFDDGYQISMSLIRDESNKSLDELCYFINTEKEWFTLD